MECVSRGGPFDPNSGIVITGNNMSCTCLYSFTPIATGWSMTSCWPNDTLMLIFNKYCAHVFSISNI